MAEIRVPDIGDAENVEVIELCAAPGDVIGADDAILVIESDKASMEVPAGIAGTVEELLVDIGDAVQEGQLIARLSAPEDTRGTGAHAQENSGAAPGESEPADLREAPDASPANRIAADVQDPPATREIVVSVPDIGDARDVVVVEIAIKVGDEVEEDGLAVVVESDKATMEIPAGATGVVAAVHVQDGDPVAEGTQLFTLMSAGALVAPRAESAMAAGNEAAREGLKPEASADTSPARAPQPSGQRPLAPAKPPGSEIRERKSPGAKVYAGPATRRLARELGVSLAEVDGSGARGRIVKDDVKLFVKQAMGASVKRGERRGAGIPAVPEIDFSKYGPVQSMPLTRVRAAGARNLQASWLNVPHVTQHDEADVTELEAFRASLQAEASERGIKLTPLPFIVKACCYALKEFPTFNASLDAAVENYLLKRYYNIGLAVDSEQGLVVPVLKDADRKGIWELAAAISDLAEKVRNRRLAIDDAQGGTFSISSLGALGGTAFTPIVNAPEVAILGVARLATKPVWDGSEFQPRRIMPLSLSYDHRAINGAEAGRFVGYLAGLLNDIRRLSL